MYNRDLLLKGDGKAWKSFTVIVQQRMIKSAWSSQFTQEQMFELFAAARETFWIKINQDTFEDKGKLVEFFLQIVNYKVKEHWADKTKRKAISLEHYPLAIEGHNDFLKKEIIEVINQLGEKCRAILHLDINGYKHEEIAQELGVTYGTSRVRLSNCKKTLFKLLNNE